MISSYVEVYTDGACKNNPGPGGWGVVLCWEGHEKELYGGESDTTNNRMELIAVIRALEAISRPIPIHIYTDSKYVQQGMLTWMDQWKKRHWLTSDKKPVKNQDLWQQLDQLNQSLEVQWHWVKGHAGHPLNERADALARLGLQEHSALNSSSQD
jgi:ribonuclease HI